MAMVESRSPRITIQGTGKQENAERFIAVALFNVGSIRNQPSSLEVITYRLHYPAPRGYVSHLVSPRQVHSTLRTARGL